MKQTRRSFVKTTALLGASSFLPFDLVDAQDALPAASATPRFAVAKPVWAQGREREMNVTLLFSADVSLDDSAELSGAIFRATGSSIMRVAVNGEYACYGPARGPRGWFRVDEWAVGKFLRKGLNTIRVEIAGYNSVSYYLLDQPAFLQAELVDGAGVVLAATGADKRVDVVSFEAVDRTGVRIQKVQRHGYHRTFIEAYDLRKEPDCAEVTLALQPNVELLPRRVPYPELDVLPVVGWGKRGVLELRDDFKPWRGAAITGINDKFNGYKEDELELILTDEIGKFKTRFVADAPLEFGSTYREGDAQIVDFGADYAGFWGFEVETTEETELAITFDEILSKEGDVNFLRFSTCNAVKWTLPASDKPIACETFDPQAGRYVKIHCLRGSFKLNKFYMREYAHPHTREASFDCSDEHIVKVYNAAVLTFRSNAVDVFSDCPHRERAGWMCDSFFTARAAFDLTGKTNIEAATYENYRLPKSFPNLPDGALPMCYPSDTWHGQFIPNWMMWFVVELEEYFNRSGDRRTVDLLHSRVAELFRFFKQYENEDGLLEKLPNRVFVEWSDANKFLQDVNYPTNMLYAAALDAASRLYDVPQWHDQAEKMRDIIREQSFDGQFFVDHARRNDDGSLEILRDRSEVCQYFAFFFKTATPETFPELWATLLDKFGPNREKEKGFPEVCKANSFVGNVVRMELLSQAGRVDQILAESVAYNEYMADRTGTLWENAGASASCNHGFASHIAHVFYRDVLGIRKVDAVNKTIEIKIGSLESLDWASGAMPVPGGAVKLRWEKKDGKVDHTLDAPEGYRVVVEE
ncbi:MAG: hypothetical protein IJM54_06870 [Thermoguttaceae bacterium]|nr:hypothetical protein [Thermoguttaceae bacterium]